MPLAWTARATLTLTLVLAFSPQAISVPPPLRETNARATAPLEILLCERVSRVRIAAPGSLIIDRAGMAPPEAVVNVTDRSDLPFAVEIAGERSLMAGPLRIASPASTPLELRAVDAATGRVALAGSYRGAIELRPWRGAAALVNLIHPDEYVASVVACEIGPDAPLEALKAQAVAARSYAMAEAAARRLGSASPPWDLVTSVADQVYRGADVETRATRQAAVETAHQVLVAGGVVVRSVYHACSGGSTTSPMDAWLLPIPGPTPVFDGVGDCAALSDEAALRRFLQSPPPTVFGSSHPAFRWRVTFSAEQLTRAFARSLPLLSVEGARDVGAVRDVQVGARSLDGRATVLRIVGTRGEAIVRGDAIRWAFGSGRVGDGGLRSTLFAIDRQGAAPPYSGYTLIGGGWGHGIGMSQAGAIDMARRGLSYRAILKHYYGDAELSPLEVVDPR